MKLASSQVEDNYILNSFCTILGATNKSNNVSIVGATRCVHPMFVYCNNNDIIKRLSKLISAVLSIKGSTSRSELFFEVTDVYPSNKIVAIVGGYKIHLSRTTVSEYLLGVTFKCENSTSLQNIDLNKQLLEVTPCIAEEVLIVLKGCRSLCTN